jgi:type I restriction enzyme R subunit
VKLASGDYVDMKVYEPAMRHLLDTYIRAEESEKLSAFDDMTLVQLIVERGEGAVENLPKGLREDPEAMAETIENNVRRLIIDEMAVNPKYYERMSQLLDALIQERKQQALDYKTYLARIVELTRKITKPETQSAYPVSINSPARRALYDNLKDRPGLDEILASGKVADMPDVAEAAAMAVDEAIRRVKKADWRGNRFKEREVRNAIREVLREAALVDAMFEIVKAQRDY